MKQSISLVFWPHKDEKELLQKLEIIGRNAYQSFGRINEDSCYRFMDMIIGKKHLGILEHEIMTFKIVTNRAIANELVRHRIASYVQESTRYVNYDKISPDFITYKEMSIWDEAKIEKDFEYYKKLINDGVPPETARDFLPLGLRTTIYATMNIKTWFYFLKMRSAPAAHPLMRELSQQIITEFKKFIPFITEKMLEGNKNE